MTSNGNKSARPLSNAERQRRFRERRAAYVRKLEGGALRNESLIQPITSLRNDASADRGSDDPIDDELSKFRKRDDQQLAGYVALLKTPGLSDREIETISTRLLKMRQAFLTAAKASRRRPPTVVGRKLPKGARAPKGRAA